MGNLGDFERNAYRRVIQFLIRCNKTAAEPFVMPVPANLPGYHELIKLPMDLSTIRHKLDSNAYSSRGDFEADFLLMVLNAYTFNHPDNFVHKYAVELEASFRDLMQKAIRDINDHLVQERQRSIDDQLEERRKRRMQLRRQASSFSRRSMLENLSSSPLDVDRKLQALEQQLTYKRSTNYAPPIDASVVLSEADKLQLITWLEAIPAVHFAGIRTILDGDDAASCGQDDDSLELDLERLTPATQRALVSFVHAAIQG